MRIRKLSASLAGVAAVALLATACGGGGDTDTSADTADDQTAAATGEVLTVGMPNGTQTENQSPFATGSAALSLGYAFVIYEPLMMANDAKPAEEPQPWLAESIEWNDDYTQAVVTPREGVTWSDGEAFDAEDVAFSIQLRQDHEGLNTSALPIESVESDGTTVTVTFGSPQYVNTAKLADMLIVPEHLWADVEDPTTYTNTEPVGTGPYTLESWTPQAATVVARDDYWGGELSVPEIRYSSYNDNNALTTALTTGEAQWGWTFIADYENVYIAADPEHYHQYAAAGLGIDALFVNNEEKPFDDVAFRRALNMALDRQSITDVATSGVNPPITSVTGLPLPAGEEFISDELAGEELSADVEGAKQVLTDAGYTGVGEQLVDPDGEPVTFELTNPAGWNDYLTALDLIKNAAAELGAEATVQPANADGWFADIVPPGNFDATLHWTDGGATPWDLYSNMMDGAQYEPLGEPASWNFGRYRNEDVTEALATYAATTDDAERSEALATIQQHFVEDVPAIALWARPATAQYSTVNYVGWPSEEDPYNQPQPTGSQALQILLELEPATD
ncbi:MULTISPECIES: ABC transporter substrate-binding protein [unclassified Isoptericola]|uniref:ABC transporter substrate-binding protein n=1 Tax=unclassified Isoptericola TaxID=2623355 RepID=UPI0027139B13|nr:MULTISPECIES: ABC transporter substrate-binding protein [unclassified Isoptericola]MDO8143358.1 ABC transporter substrate-binding protein [Isoptericola sp. 178]MDO8147221.1 ABC transporter substrate-binding protein [Isoptericola sp. b515]MDO8150466.1 ABC transporter substrate-binding protein [Isoptericola sp. b408]